MDDKDYRVAWQSTLSGARGVDDTPYTIVEAKEQVCILNEQYPAWIHYVIKQKKSDRKLPPHD